jgi:hypothetical protein
VKLLIHVTPRGATRLRPRCLDVNLVLYRYVAPLHSSKRRCRLDHPCRRRDDPEREPVRMRSLQYVRDLPSSHVLPNERDATSAINQSAELFFVVSSVA